MAILKDLVVQGDVRILGTLYSANGSGGPGGDSVPIGALNPYIGTTAPEGYLLCQGQMVDIASYPELYAICGNTFGTATSTQFYLPDLRGQAIAGYKSGDATFGTLGALVGGKTHTHNFAHTHGVPGVSHSHNLDDNGYAKLTGWSGDASITYYELSGKPEWTSTFRLNASSAGGDAKSSPYGVGLGGKTANATPSNTTTNSQSTSTTGDGSNIQPTIIMN